MDQTNPANLAGLLEQAGKNLSNILEMMRDGRGQAAGNAASTSNPVLCAVDTPGTTQEQISAHLRGRLFFPYPVTSTVSSQTLTSEAIIASTSSQLTPQRRLDAFRRGNVKVSLPAVSPPSSKKQKVEKKETWFFIVLGDAKENRKPTQEGRMVHLTEAGLGPRKLEFVSNGGANAFLESLTKFSKEIGQEGVSWKVFYSVSTRDDSPLYPVNEASISTDDLKALKKDLKVKHFFLQPSVSLLPMPLKDRIFNSESDEDVSSDEVMSEIPKADAIDRATVEVEDLDTVIDSAALFGSAADACVTEISVTIRESIEDISATGNEANISDFDTVEEFIRTFSRKSKNCLKVNRMNGFPDASAILEAFSSAGLDPLNSLRVEYSGEDGIDAGALSQDFIWTAHSVFQTGFVMALPLFEGQKDHKSISDYDVLYQNGMYETLALFLIQSFMTTGVLCPGLSRPVFNYIVGSPDQAVDNYLDCPDYDDQEIVKKVCSYLNNPASLKDDEIISLRQDLATMRIKFALTASNKMNILRAVYHNAIFKRKRALNIVKGRIEKSPVGLFLKNKPELFVSVCPREAQMNPTPAAIIRGISNANDPEVRPITRRLLTFLQNIGSHGFKTSDFLRFVTGAPVLSDGITIKVVPPRCPIYTSSCLKQLSVPQNVEQKDFDEKMKQALGVEGRHFLLV